MSRTVPVEVSASEVQPFLLFEGEFISGYVRAWSGIGTLSWNGLDWLGTGTLLSISDVQETSDGSAQGVNVTLNGVPSAFLSLALQDVQQGGSGKVWLGFLDGGVVADPVLLFEGRLDVPTISEDAETASISISYESRLIDLNRQREHLYTDEGQRGLFAGDLGCQFVTSIREITLDWGKK